MSKLLKMKEWVTVKEAARYLSSILNEEVTAVDVYQLATEGHIKLSVYFINGTLAWPGEIKSRKETARIIEGLDGHPVELYGGVLISNEEVFVVEEDKVVKLVGVLDLPMIGGERISVLKKGPLGNVVDLVNIDGAFVAAGGRLFRLCENLNSNAFAKPSYYPPSELPEDCTIVVRPAALIDFVKTLTTDDKPEPPTKHNTDNPKATDSLLKMVIAMAVVGYKYNPAEKKSPTVAEIVADVEQLGLRIDADTVRSWLKKGAKYLVETAD